MKRISQTLEGLVRIMMIVLPVTRASAPIALTQSLDTRQIHEIGVLLSIGRAGYQTVPLLESECWYPY